MLVSSVLEGDAINVWGISDVDQVSGTVTMAIRRWSSTEPALQWSFETTFDGAASTQLASYSLGDLLNQAACELPDCGMLTFELRGAANQSASFNYIFLSSPNQVDLPDPKIEISNVQQVTKYFFTFQITGSAMAAMVTLESSLSGTFTDNGFLLWATLQIGFEASQEMTASQFASSISVISLYDLTTTE